MDDGDTSLPTRDLAKLGASGDWPSNVERDLVRLTRRTSGARHDVLYAEVLRRSLSTGLAVEAKQPIMLACDVLHEMYTHAPQKFARTVGLHGVPKDSPFASA